MFGASTKVKRYEISNRPDSIFEFAYVLPVQICRLQRQKARGESTMGGTIRNPPSRRERWRPSASFQ
jgi:hypothetical protein